MPCSLGEVMVKAAARGLSVLCIAPGEGSIDLPGAEETDLPTLLRFLSACGLHSRDRQAAGRRLAGRREGCPRPIGDSV